MYFQELVERISPKLRKITIKLNGHLSTALAGSPTYLDDEDLFQEALLHLWVCLQKGKLESKTDSYILQGCYFHLKNYLRKVKKKIDLISLDSSLGQGDNVLERTLSLRNSESFFDDFKTERLIKEIRKKKKGQEVRQRVKLLKNLD